MGAAAGCCWLAFARGVKGGCTVLRGVFIATATGGLTPMASGSGLRCRGICSVSWFVKTASLVEVQLDANVEAAGRLLQAQ